MRSLRRPVVAAFAGIVACNSVEQGIPGGGGGGGFGTDAGAATDAGAGGSGGEGTVDAGTTSGADAGGGGTGGGGNGNADAGTTVSDCAGVAPASLGTMASYSEGYDSSSGVCGAPVGNGAGIIAHFVASDRYPRFTLVNPSGGVNGRIATVAHGGVIPLPSGFLDWSFMQFRGTNEEQFMDAIDDSGRPRSAGRNFFFMYSPREQWFALDVNGGTALAGTIPVNNQKDQRRVMMFGATGSIRWGPRDLSTDSLVFGVHASSFLVTPPLPRSSALHWILTATGKAAHCARADGESAADRRRIGGPPGGCPRVRTAARFHQQLAADGGKRERVGTERAGVDDLAQQHQSRARERRKSICSARQRRGWRAVHAEARGRLTVRQLVRELRSGDDQRRQQLRQLGPRSRARRYRRATSARATRAGAGQQRPDEELHHPLLARRAQIEGFTAGLRPE